MAVLTWHVPESAQCDFPPTFIRFELTYVIFHFHLCCDCLHARLVPKLRTTRTADGVSESWMWFHLLFNATARVEYSLHTSIDAALQNAFFTVFLNQMADSDGCFLPFYNFPPTPHMVDRSYTSLSGGKNTFRHILAAQICGPAQRFPIMYFPITQLLLIPLGVGYETTGKNGPKHTSKPSIVVSHARLDRRLIFLPLEINNKNN